MSKPTAPPLPPINRAPVHFTLPEHKELRLSNGATLIAVEDFSQPIVAVSAVSRLGAAEDEIWGETHQMAAQMNKGVRAPNGRSLSAQDIAETIDFTGGSLSVSCAYDSLSAQLGVLSEFLPTTLDTLADVVLFPSFPEEELERLRRQTLVEIEQANADAAYLSSLAFMRAFYGDAAYGHPLVGTLETTERLSTRDCARAYARSFSHDRLFFAAAGAFHAEELARALEERFSLDTFSSRSLGESSDRIFSRKPSFAANARARVALIEKPAAAQTSLRVGFPTANRHDDDFLPMQCLNMIFGGNFISRLNRNLREEKGFTYGVHSGIDARKYSSALVLHTHVGSEIVGEAVAEILREIERLGSKPVGEDELETTRNYMVGSFALRAETPTQVVSLLSSLELYNLPNDYYERYVREISSMTTERLLEVQRRRFRAEGLTIAASGNVSELERQLRNVGEISVVAPDGSLSAFS